MTDYAGAVPMFVDPARTFLDAQPGFAVVIHKTAGFTSAQEVAQYFATNEKMKSAHYVVGQDGLIVQCVPEKDGAGGNCCLEAGHADYWNQWPADFNFNLITISIEHVDPAPDNSTPVTDAQKRASFHLVADICRRHHIPMRSADVHGGITGHDSLDPIDRARCPGNYPWTELFQFLAGGGMAIPAEWQDNGQILTAPNGQVVLKGFRDHILAAAAWDPSDVPLEHEHAQHPLEEGFPQPNNVGTRQTFNYSMLAWSSTRQVYRVGLGNEFLFVYNDRARIKAQLGTARKLVATLQQDLSQPTVDQQKALAEVQTLQAELQQLAAAPERSNLMTISMLSGPAGRTLLGAVPLRIGRTQENQLVVSDLKASASHAELRPEGHGYSITDLGSTNGTFVNERALAPHVPYFLNAGDAIRIGDSTFTYEVSGMQPDQTVIDVRLGERVRDAAAKPVPKRRPIEIVTYNPHWPTIYEAEKQRVLTALEKTSVSERITAVHHIGSTSVPGLSAKPIVDLMIGVRGQTDLNTFPAAALTALGYVHRPFSPSAPPPPTPPRLLFSKYVAPATNVHVFVYGGTRWRGHLAVRDYLQSHPKTAATYEHLKRIFAAQHGNDIAAYGRAKRSFLDSLEQVALGQHPHSRVVEPFADTSCSGGGIQWGDPSWQFGVWYVQNDDGCWSISPNQNPDTSSVGAYVMFDGNSWSTITGASVVGIVANVSLTDLVEAAGVGTLVMQPYSVELQRPDGTTFTCYVYPPGYTNFQFIPNSGITYGTYGETLVWVNADGTVFLDDVAGTGIENPAEGDTPGYTGPTDWGPPPDDTPPEDWGGFYDNPYGQTSP